MIRRSFEWNLRFNEATQGVRQFRPCRIQDSNVVQAGRAGWRRLAPRALPCVQADVMMITTGRHKRRLLAEALSKFKAEHVAAKGQRAFQAGNLQMNVANPDAGIHGLRAGVWFHACLRVQQSASTAQFRGSCYLVKHKTKDEQFHDAARRGLSQWNGSSGVTGADADAEEIVSESASGRLSSWRHSRQALPMIATTTMIGTRNKEAAHERHPQKPENFVHHVFHQAEHSSPVPANSTSSNCS